MKKNNNPIKNKNTIQQNNINNKYLKPIITLPPVNTNTISTNNTNKLLHLSKQTLQPNFNINAVNFFTDY